MKRYDVIQCDCMSWDADLIDEDVGGDFVKWEDARLFVAAIKFIASQNDKKGNWAVEIAKRVLKEDEYKEAIK